MKNIIRLFILSFLFACSNKQERVINIDGNWAYILSDSSYCEAYINDGKLSFHSDKDGYFGPYYYDFKKDSIFFYDISYKIEHIGCETMLWFNNSVKIEMKNIDISQVADSSNINPFYLRRCNFLVTKGLITVQEAIDYLSKLKNVSDINEEIILSR